MILFRRKPASLLALLFGMALLSTFAFTVTAMKDSVELDEVDTETETERDQEEDSKDKDIEIDDLHTPVLRWLKARAVFAEERHFVDPWIHFDLGEDDEIDWDDLDLDFDNYHFQNGYYFAHKHLELVLEDATKPTTIVATSDIPEGALLVGIPSDTFVYKRDTPTYKMLHPCDVASKMLNTRTYRYPQNTQHEGRMVSSLPDFVRPFLDSILSFVEYDDYKNKHRDRHSWSRRHLESLQKVLGNELDPKANTMGLWGETNNTHSKIHNNNNNIICQHPNPRDSLNSQIVDHFYNSTRPNAEKFRELFETTISTVVTRSWNHRMVPIYHWISRGDDSNVVHSEHWIDKSTTSERYWRWESEESAMAPSIYKLHASRPIAKGETIVMPYHSVAQKFAIEGAVGRDTDYNDDLETTSYRFWTQTLHDQWGTDFAYGEQDSYNDYLAWDYYPKTQTIEWIHKSRDITITNPNQSKKSLRNTQRNILQAQYLRLRGMEEEAMGWLELDPTDSGMIAIVEYYELWVESLGVVLAHARPHRSSAKIPTDATKECREGATDGDEDEETCLASTSTLTSTSVYDDLRERYDGDPIDYNRFCFPSHDCTNAFKQTIYEMSQTPYATLEWTRSYIGGGSIEDHRGDTNKEAADEREQDTCLFLDNVLHSCLAFRPHVHETLIHYPASFLPRGGLKRVLYVGGGDLVLLHELLRYESVELVIGMEIDQDVLRQSFRHYGIQPKFEDERVHWWFGDAAKSLTLLPPDEYFGTFDMVLIDLVVEIFDGLRVGEHHERLVDYMAKLLKPEGIFVRQEDWPSHNVVDFAKYTVDLNVNGMPHTCSQYFTMASHTIDFSNQERVDHELEGLVWYEPKIGTHDHTTMWGEYRNNLEPPERVCVPEVAKKQESSKSTATNSNANTNNNVLPSKGLFVAIEAEKVTMDLRELPLVQAAVTKALEDLELTNIVRHDISVGEEPTWIGSMLFVFEEGYLAIRTFAEQKFSSMDLQLWNDISKRDSATSALVGALGGDSTSDSTSTFVITTGGMLGSYNIDDHSTSMVPSAWCDNGDDSVAEAADETSTNGMEAEALSGFKIVVQQMLTDFVGKGDSINLVLCPDKSSRCRAREDIEYGLEAQVISFHACPSIANGDETIMKECEQQMLQAITNALPSTKDSAKKIQAIVIDSEAPRELGQIATKLFVGDPSSYQWLSHDYVILAPSTSNAATANSGYPQSWRYQLLERFRTDMVEFHPVYHATMAFHGVASSVSSSISEWTIGVLSAGNPRFYEHAVDSLDAIRGTKEKTLLQDVILVETKVGAISHIPDYQPSKWATPSDYDIEPAKQQYWEQRPLGVQLLLQREKIPMMPHNIEIDERVLSYQEEDDNWFDGYVVDIIQMDGEIRYLVAILDEDQDRDGYQSLVDRKNLVKFDYAEEETTPEEAVPFGATVLAMDSEVGVQPRVFLLAQVVNRHIDGRYKVYYLHNGVFEYLDRRDIVEHYKETSFKSPSDTKMFSSCDEFYELMKKEFPDVLKDADRTVVQREIGDGCLVASSWPRNGGDPTTLLATYDGQLHMEFNVYSSQDVYEGRGENSLISIIKDWDMDGTEKRQSDLHPRGYGRVVSFRHDLKKAYFGTKYPRKKIF